jgi:drug/metabolite transporter (DMT)-like permease
LVLFIGPSCREHCLVSSTYRASISGALGMTFVGGSVAVSGALADAPMHTAQSLRYAIACALLIAWCRLTGRRLHRPRGAEWLWLIGVAVSGLVVFNVALIEGSRHAEPAVLAVAVACVPIALATIGPLLEGRSPRARVLAAAVVVSTGAVVVEGLGRSDAVGLLWALTVFVCEAGFTLLAVPLLGRHGPEGVSVHTTWLASTMFWVLGVSTEGWWPVSSFDIGDLLAITYLAVGVTAVAFILWYSCVHSLGSARAGLLTGVAPVAAAVIGVPVTGSMPAAAVWGGIALIASGLALGLGAPSDVTSGRRVDSGGAPSSGFRTHSSSTIGPSPHASGRSGTADIRRSHTPVVDPA